MMKAEYLEACSFLQPDSAEYEEYAGTTTLARVISNKRLAQAGYYSILDRYEFLHLCD